MNYCKYCMAEIEDDTTVCPVCKKDLTREEPPHHLKPGTVLFGKYYVGAALGEGGFGITYLGINTKLDLKVAIKEFYPFGYVHRSSSTSATVVSVTETNVDDVFEKGRERFLSEAKTLAKFNNETGVVSVYDFFEDNNTAYIVMEYLEGQTLKAYLNKKGVLSYEETLSLLLPVMQSLAEVHGKGLIHRDISPDNIMITGNKVKLLDFGAARYADGHKSLSIMLKHGYAPEEQYRRKGEQGSWTDVYALSATIYKCITGVTPDQATDRTFEDSLKKPSEFGVKIDPRCEAALMKGLSVYAKNRYRTVNELITGLTGKDDTLAITVVPEPDRDKTVFEGSAENADKTAYIGAAAGLNKTDFDRSAADKDKTEFDEPETDEAKTVFDSSETENDEVAFGESETDEDKTVFGGAETDEDKTVFGNAEADKDKAVFDEPEANADKTVFGGSEADDEKTVFGGEPVKPVYTAAYTFEEYKSNKKQELISAKNKKRILFKKRLREKAFALAIVLLLIIAAIIEMIFVFSSKSAVVFENKSKVCIEETEAAELAGDLLDGYVTLN